MHIQQNIIDCYNLTAKQYAKQYADELRNKHLDRLLLQSFAAENKHQGKTIDLGCGPGQTTKFLYDNGQQNILGTDLSPEMIATARNMYPGIEFDTADMLNLEYAHESFGSTVAFYSIVHFTEEQVQKAFREVFRVLTSNSPFLFSFHIGTEKIHVDRFLEQDVNIDFYFFETEKILKLVTETGFTIQEVIERQPYAGAEHQSKRAYITAVKNKQ